MTSLWLMLALLLLLAFCFIIWPLMPFLRKKQIAHAIQKQENVDIFHDRLHELELEKSQNTLDSEAFMTLKAELEKSLLQDAQGQENNEFKQTVVSGKHWSVALSLGIAVVIISLSMYFKIGRSDDLFISQAMAEQTIPQEGEKTPPSMEKSIALLESKIEQDPTNKEKLFLLANSYSAVGQFNKAAKIYEQMASITDINSEEYASLKGAEAQTLFQASGEKMTTEIQEIIDKALATDPLEPSSLMLQGIHAFTSSNYKQAISFWTKAKQKAGEEQVVRFIEPAIQAAQQKSGISVTEVKTAKNKSQNNTQSSPSVTINLTLSESLKPLVNDEHVIFVFARPVGGRMPLAAERIKVKNLPIQIVLDDSKAAMPTAKISSVDVVEVTARVSLSGKPMPQKGDLYTTVKDIVVKDNPTLNLEINQLVK